MQLAGAGLGGAVPLEDGHAEILPALLQGRRQERPCGQEEAEVTAQLLVDAAEQARAEAHGQTSGDPAKPGEGGLATALVDLALDGAPEEVEHLGDDDHRGHPVIAQRIEDDAGIPAAHVQDVRPDRQRVVEPDRLLEQMREREQRDDPMLHPGDDPVERVDRGEDVVVGEHHALGRSRRPGREDEFEDVLGGRGGPRLELRLPVGRERRIGFGGHDVERRRREMLEACLARVGGVAAGAQDEVGRARGTHDPLDRVGRHPKVERDEDQPCPHRAEVDRGEFRGRGRPGQEAVAALEAGRTQAPCSDTRAVIELAVAPGRGRTVVEAQAERSLVVIGRDGLSEQVEQGSHRDLGASGWACPSYDARWAGS